MKACYRHAAYQRNGNGKKVYNLPSNALFHEDIIYHSDLLGIGQVSGLVDFLVSSTENDISPNLNPDIAPCERKFLVEAKRGPTINETANRFICPNLCSAFGTSTHRRVRNSHYPCSVCLFMDHFQ
jgi:hypothetical protein